MDLNKIAPIVTETIQQSLLEKRYRFGYARRQGLGDKVASGRLINSVSTKVVERKDEVIMEVSMEDYAQWVQSGRLPGKKGVPVDAIEKWIKDRGLQGRVKKGRFITRRSFAFAIQSNIKKFGIRPSNFLDVALDKLENDPRVQELIENASFEDLINALEGI